VPGDARVLIPLSALPSATAASPAFPLLVSNTQLLVDAVLTLDATIWAALKPALHAYIARHFAPTTTPSAYARYLSLAVYSGKPTLQIVANATNDLSELRAAIDSYVPAVSDPSTDLYSAVINAVDALSTPSPSSVLSTANLIVLSGSADRAGRHTSDEALAAAAASNVGVWVIGVQPAQGLALNVPFLKSLARQGLVLLSTTDFGGGPALTPLVWHGLGCLCSLSRLTVWPLCVRSARGCRFPPLAV
jgi:hypothetical protein